MKKLLFISLSFIVFGSIGQSVQIQAPIGIPCAGDRITYSANLSGTSTSPACLSYNWTAVSGTVVSGKTSPVAEIQWNSSATSGSVSVAVFSSGDGGIGLIDDDLGGGGLPIESTGDCSSFSINDSKPISFGSAASGTLSVTRSHSNYICPGETVTFQYTVTGDADFTGWYRGSSWVSNANPYTTGTPGTYSAKATLSSTCVNKTLTRGNYYVSRPHGASPGEILGARTVYSGEPVDGQVRLLNTSGRIQRWEKKGVSQSSFSHFASPPNESTYILNYSNKVFDEPTQIRARFHPSCSGDDYVYSNSITIDVIEYIPDYHSITTIKRDNTGVIGKSALYFNKSGLTLQTQSWNAQDDVIFASEPLYDNDNRAVGQTLAAPIGRNTLGFQTDFATIEGDDLTESDWNGATPKLLDNSDPNTLGHYYSSNTSGGLIPETNYPYTVSNYYEDGSNENKSSSSPGDFHFLKSGKNAVTKILPVFDDELRFYAEIRNILVGSFGSSDRLVKQLVIDGNGNQSITYMDDQGMTIATAIGNSESFYQVTKNVKRFETIEFHRGTTTGTGRTYYDLINDRSISGTIPPGIYSYENTTGGSINFSNSLTYQDFTYNFYDNKGQLVASMTPKGTQFIFGQGTMGTIDTKEELPYTTLYEYDFQGRLTSMTEPDAGTTKYKYRKDGQIRYSLNENQTQSRYSYTDYDGLGRPIESGEITSTTSFNAASPDGLLVGGTKSDWIRTTYDVADKTLYAFIPNCPPHIQCDPIDQTIYQHFGLTDSFLSGAVSFTESEEVKSWYGYDDQGRVTGFLQYFKHLRRYFLIEYAYDFLGNVIKVGFQPQTFGNDVSEALWHHYTYDKNQRLKTVHTSVYPEDHAEYDLYLHATYEYYPHGPLKRIELAENMQGIDYTYTPQGWLKSINHPIRSLDPGGDGSNGFEEDLFGMTLEYFEGDFATSKTGIGSLNLDENAVPQQYNGNIRATVFGEGDSYSSNYKQAKYYDNPQMLSYQSTLTSSLTARAEKTITLQNGFNSNGHTVSLKITPDVPASIRTTDMKEGEIYAYTYDEKYQLKEADYSVDGTNTNAYDVSVDGYDENGNIDGIERYGNNASSLRDDFGFVYSYDLSPSDPDYDPNHVETNRLIRVTGYIDRISYNGIGQVIGIEYTDPEKTDFNIEYDVTGKVTRVYKFGNSANTLVEFAYDDRGFRIMKRVGNVENWYVRDASGQVMAIYNGEANDPSNGVAQIELPIYGASRLGMAYKNPDHYKYIYELSDHLGNVRAIVTKLGLQATASMEVDNDANGIDEYEAQYFDNLNTRQLDVNNSHGGQYASHTHPGEPLGPTTTLRVESGDVINLEVFVKEGGTSGESPTPYGLGDLLEQSANDAVVAVEGSALSNAVGTNIGNILAGITTNSSKAKAYLQYILFDESFNVIHHDYMALEDGTALLSGWTELSLSDVVTEDGYLYAYVVNESTKDVFFDDFTFQVLGTRALKKTDYYPFGAVAKVWNNNNPMQQEFYRHDYQGQYAEKDTTTGWSSFEARMYDPLIGRWLAVDPARQFVSGYLGMGNNPINGVDPDGRFFKFKGDRAHRRALRRELRFLRRNSPVFRKAYNKARFSLKKHTVYAVEDKSSLSGFEKNNFAFNKVGLPSYAEGFTKSQKNILVDVMLSGNSAVMAKNDYAPDDNGSTISFIAVAFDLNNSVRADDLAGMSFGELGLTNNVVHEFKHIFDHNAKRHIYKSEFGEAYQARQGMEMRAVQFQNTVIQQVIHSTGLPFQLRFKY